jgi:hypothetical protein
MKKLPDAQHSKAGSVNADGLLSEIRQTPAGQSLPQRYRIRTIDGSDIS